MSAEHHTQSDPRLSTVHIGLAVLSGLLLAAPYLCSSMFILAWVGFVPLLVALRGATARQSYVLGGLTGFVLYAGVTYWIVDFLQKLQGFGWPASGALALMFWAYNAQGTALAVSLFVWARRRVRVRVPEGLLFAATLVAVYSVFPTFAAVHLSETQIPFPQAVQAVSLTGAQGLDFMIALVSFAMFDALTRRSFSSSFRAVLPAAIGVAMWFAYGTSALSRWTERIEHWPKIQVGIVQPNESPSVAIPPVLPGFARAYPPEMQVTERLVAAGADLVIWPETRFKAFFRWPHVRASYSRHIAALGKPLLFHDLEGARHGGEPVQYNTAVFLDAQGAVAQTYRKRKRMAFGEYLPVVSDVPAVRDWVRQHFGQFFAPIAQGERNVVFSTSDIDLVPLICYEIVLPEFVAAALAGAPRGKVLVALSNDGWFGYTRQPYLHAYASVLRAVENRVPLVHVINNGPSLVAMPNGVIRFLGDANRSAGYVIPTPYSKEAGGSFYSAHPGWFVDVLRAAVVLVLLIALLQRSLPFAATYRRARSVHAP